jgi:hypothetical protein
MFIEHMFDSEAWLRQRGRRVPHATPARFPGAALSAPAIDQENDPVGQKTVRFSDLSGQLITGDEAPARIVIREHPALAGGPVEIEALTGEARDIEKAAGQAAVLDLYFPGDDQPRRVAMDAAAFDSVATDAPMGQILASARPARRAPRSRTTTERAAAGSAAAGSTGAGSAVMEPAAAEPIAPGRTGPSGK